MPFARRHAVRILAGLAVLALAASVAVVVRNARLDAAIARARLQLIEGDFDAAASSFEALRGSGRVGRTARAGLAIARAARETGAGVPAGDDARAAVEAAGVPLRPLLDGAMRRRRYPAAIALGGLAADAGDPSGAAYHAAALVELGRDADARALAAAHPDAFRTGLGGEVAQVLDFRRRGSTVILRDRAGRLLGGVTGAGALLPAAGIAAEWVPPLALQRLPAATPGMRLALDLALTRIAQESLAGRRGTVVLLDPATGALRVALSDAATFAGGGTPAFDQQLEPASIQKLVTSTAALRAGLDADAEVARMTCAGSARYGGGSLWCAYPGGRLSGLGHALAISCNVAFANLGLRIGREALIGELGRFGFDGDGPGDGRIREASGDERQLADLSVGLSATEITPVHAARMAAVFGTDGTMPTVVFVGGEDGAMGMSPRPAGPTPPGRRVLEAAWVPVMRRAMAAVTAPGGTADGVAPPAFPVAMKTGTASEPGRGYHVNYVGVGPMPEPSVAFCVRVTNQPSSAAVNRAAREVLGALLTRLGASRGGR